MLNRIPTQRILPLAVFAITALLPLQASALQTGWNPVDPAHLALKESSVEKDADAEVIFWDLRVEKQLAQAVVTQYLRVKVFNDRGREARSKIVLPYANSTKIEDIAGRTIKSDGTIIDLKPDAILDTMVGKIGKFKLHAKTFNLPAVEPGSIVEYRWRETQKSASDLRLYLQDEFPIQSIKLSIKGSESPLHSLTLKQFNMEKTIFKEEAKGFQSAQFTNVPAFRPEPMMPPENDVRRWILIYYNWVFMPSGLAYWNALGKGLYNDAKLEMKVDDEVKKAMALAVGDATTPAQKLERLFDFCRTKIKNVSDDASGMTDADRAKLKRNKSPADTLRRGSGDGYEISMLFASLATAAGFEARYAKVGDRSDGIFDKFVHTEDFLRAYDIAVRVGDEWQFFDPGSLHLPFGMLRWQEEGNEALISDPVDPVFVWTPLSPPAKSLTKRTASLRLSDDGALEGDVRIEMTGHTGAQQRETLGQDSPEEREKTIRERFQRQITTAELSDIKLENLNDPAKPFVVSYRVRVPGYAQKTGRRLLLQPAFFCYGLKPVFSASERRYPVYFNFPWSEADVINIELPPGFELDNAEAPSSYRANGVSEYDVKVQFDQTKRTLTYRRNFIFGLNGNILFPARGNSAPVSQVYPQLKLFFEAIHLRDRHIIAIKQSSPSPK